MNYKHKNQAGGQWQELPLTAQLANIGSEVERTLKWRDKGRGKIADNAFDRSLELFDLTMSGKNNVRALKELARARELWVDFYFGDNIYQSTPESWRRYFYYFTLLARR